MQSAWFFRHDGIVWLTKMGPWITPEGSHTKPSDSCRRAGRAVHSGGSIYLPMPIMTLSHGIPVWFLVLSLFLPRISLFIGWIHMWWFFVPQPWAAVLWALLPRVLVLIFIHGHQGYDLWFWIHLLTAVVVWSGSGSFHNNRRARKRRV